MQQPEKDSGMANPPAGRHVRNNADSVASSGASNTIKTSAAVLFSRAYKRLLEKYVTIKSRVDTREGVQDRKKRYGISHLFS